MKKKLTNKQKMFCKEYLKDLNATQAAIRAGYSKKTAEVIGFENLRKPKINEQIQKEMDKRSERIKINADDVLEGILKVRDNAMQVTDIMESNEKGERVKIAEDMIDRNAALKASELLGKHLKLFTDKIELNGTLEVKDNLTDKELAEKIKLLQSKIKG